ncbi:MAG: prepilin-type N-terminal cleavage/methylation domain-containing protein [Oscillospiraceae bacterium]|nr:prepilin-type N-terminal cleavage/methylation domain-containing protein [Oscillospiraceae bacterium]
MKKTKSRLKGFTLIELIVVMAIFGVILVAAMQLMLPATKVLVQTEHYENSQAVAKNIADYLESTLRPAEFLDAYRGDRNIQAIAEDYAIQYYEGVLRSGSTIDGTIKYADGKIHVLHIDNSDQVNTKLVNYTFDAKFDNGAVSVTLNNAETIDNAINKAYYDTYNLQIKVGEFDETTWDVDDEDSYDNFTNHISAKNTTFTIKCESNKEINGAVRTLYHTAFMTLENINGKDAKTLNYYVIDEKQGADPAIDPNVLSIVQIGTDNMTARGSAAFTATMARDRGTLTGRTRPEYATPSTAPIKDYYFVYSYGSEINTNP